MSLKRNLVARNKNLLHSRGAYLACSHPIRYMSSENNDPYKQAFKRLKRMQRIQQAFTTFSNLPLPVKATGFIFLGFGVVKGISFALPLVIPFGIGYFAYKFIASGLSNTQAPSKTETDIRTRSTPPDSRHSTDPMGILRKMYEMEQDVFGSIPQSLQEDVARRIETHAQVIRILGPVQSIGQPHSVSMQSIYVQTRHSKRISMSIPVSGKKSFGSIQVISNGQEFKLESIALPNGRKVPLDDDFSDDTITVEAEDVRSS